MRRPKFLKRVAIAKGVWSVILTSAINWDPTCAPPATVPVVQTTARGVQDLTRDADPGPMSVTITAPPSSIVATDRDLLAPAEGMVTGVVAEVDIAEVVVAGMEVIDPSWV